MLGKKIKKLRKEKRLSIRKLSEISNVSSSYLSDIERGVENNPSLTKLKGISGALGCTVSDLIEECET